MTTHRYQGWIYDVWGNDEDGFEVNDRHRVVEFDADPDTTPDFNAYCMEQLGFETTDYQTVEDSDPNHTIFFETLSNRYPLGEVEVID